MDVWTHHGCLPVQPPPEAAEWPCLPKLDADTLRKVIPTFPRKTSTGPCALHPRLLWHLSDESLEMLDSFFARCEQLLAWPADRL
eukprot:6491396-Pyramimonas_sp.AAC.1